VLKRDVKLQLTNQRQIKNCKNHKKGGITEDHTDIQMTWWWAISPLWFCGWLSSGFTSQSTRNRSFLETFPKPISWLGMEKQNLTQQKPAWKQRGPILISALRKFVSYLLRHLSTHLQSGTFADSDLSPLTLHVYKNFLLHFWHITNSLFYRQVFPGNQLH